MTKLKNKNKIKEILYTRQYSPKKIKPKKVKEVLKGRKNKKWIFFYITNFIYYNYLICYLCNTKKLRYN